MKAMSDQQKLTLAVLEHASNQLPDCHEKVVLLVMIGNLHCGASNIPLSDLSEKIALQLIKDLQS